MRAFVTGLALFCLLACNSLAQSKAMQQTVLVKLSDHTNSITYQVMTQGDFRQLETDIRKEKMAWGRATMKTQIEWKKMPKYGKMAFPRTAISYRKATKSGTFKSPELAEVKAEKLREKAEEIQKRVEQKKRKRKPRTASRGRDKLRDIMIGPVKPPKQSEIDRAARLEAIEAERVAFKNRAIEMFLNALHAELGGAQ